MLKYMYDNYLDDYNWFLRADDDVYVRTKELVDFLSQLDPSEPLYMGQPGLGKPEDRERLKLLPHEHFCMGGPGILYSNGLLRRLGPHLEECLQNVVVSYNEDVEVGRCVSRRAGVQCTWSYQVRSGGCFTFKTEVLVSKNYCLLTIQYADKSLLQPMQCFARHGLQSSGTQTRKVEGEQSANLINCYCACRLFQVCHIRSPT